MTDSDLTAGTDRLRRNGLHGGDMDTTTRPSVRDLIAELAATEDVLREHRRTAGTGDPEVRHRQREIVTELRRRRRQKFRSMGVLVQV